MDDSRFTMTNAGLHFPNDDVSSSELDRIMALGCKDYVLYVSAFDDSAFNKYRIILARVAQGLQGSAVVRVHLRIESRGPLGALFDSQRLKLVHDELEGKYYSIGIRNEPNIESPNSPAEYKTYVHDLISKTPTSILPKLALAPISPGKPYYLEWVNAGISASSPLTKLHMHAYGNPSESSVVFAEIRNVWSHEIICTEHNFGAGRIYNLQTWADDLKGVLAEADKKSILAVCVFIWRWATPDMTLPTQVNVIGTPMEAAIKAANGISPTPTPTPTPTPIVNYTSPNHDSTRLKTLGVVLHATRGGSPSYETEFDGTVSWFNSPTSKASAHVVVSPTRIWYPIRDDVIGWHAGHPTDYTKSLNTTHLGIELCQPKQGDAIPESEFKAAVQEVAKLCTKYKIPAVRGLTGIIEHYETEAGIAVGKSDIKPPFDITRFVAEVKAIVSPTPTPTPTPNVYWANMRIYGEWALARCANKQDPRNFGDFLAHLKALNLDYNKYHDYGWPA